LLFFHGAFAMPHAYLPLLKLLSKKFHVIAPTHPGHGKAFSIPMTWKFEDFISTYIEFTNTLKLSPDVLIGHSFGGAFSLALAGNWPNAKIVVLDPVGLPFPIIVKEYMKGLVSEGERAIKDRPDLTTIQDLTKAVGTLVTSVTQHPENIPWFYRYSSTLDLTETLKMVPNHVWFLWGKNDVIVPISVGKTMAALIPCAKLVELPDLEHNYAVTHPEFTNEQILLALG